ncbi:MAG: hypothetical protein WA737_16625, partial [Candidatus Acidiferrales bacterium]
MILAIEFLQKNGSGAVFGRKRSPAGWRESRNYRVDDLWDCRSSRSEFGWALRFREAAERLQARSHKKLAHRKAEIERWAASSQRWQ